MINMIDEQCPFRHLFHGHSTLAWVAPDLLRHRPIFPSQMHDVGFFVAAAGLFRAFYCKLTAFFLSPCDSRWWWQIEFPKKGEKQ